MNNQQSMNQPTLSHLHLNKYIEGLCYYPFAVNSDKCIGSCNTLIDLSIKVCVKSKTKDLIFSDFNMIAGINNSKILTKHMSC